MVGRGMGKKRPQHLNAKQKGVTQHAFEHESVATDAIFGWGMGKRPRYRSVSSVLQERAVPREDNIGLISSPEHIQQENMTNGSNTSRIASQEHLQQGNVSNRYTNGLVASQDHHQQGNISNGGNSSSVASQEPLQQENTSIGGENTKKKCNRVDVATRMKDVLVAQTILPPAPPRNNEQYSDSSGDDIDEFDLLHNQDAEGSSTKGVMKTRGGYKSVVICKLTKYGANKIQIHVPAYVLRVIGKNARQFVNYCGFVLRNTVPLTVDSWAAASEEFFDRMWLKIMDKFQPPDNEKIRLQKFCKDEFQRLFQFWKGRVSRRYKTCLKKGWEPLQHCPEGVSELDWKHCIKKFESEEFKKVSERNSRNRNSARWIKHTSGPVSFAEVEDMLTQQNNNVKPTADVVWMAQHTHRVEDGYQWVNDQRSQEVHAKLQHLVEQSSQEGSTPMTDVEMLIIVLKPRSGYLRGKGSGYRGHSKRSTLQDEEIESLKRRVAEMQEEHDRMQEEHARVLQEIRAEQKMRAREAQADQDKRIQEALAAFREEFITSMSSRL